MKTHAILLVAAAACLCQLSGSAEASFPGRNGLIAFRSDRAARGYELWVVPPNGGRVRRLNAPGWSADWSPTGRRLAVVGEVPGSNEIFVVNADGRRLRRLTHNRVFDFDPTWSPNGRWILFVAARRRANPDLYRMRPNGRGRTRLATTQFCESQPAWSPDGTRIAFLDACGNTPWPLYVMRSNGSAVERLPTGGLGGPTWSPDSRQIALDDGLRVIVLNRDGSNVHTLTSGTEPAWSPDGNEIAFSRLVPGLCEPWNQMSRILAIRTDGTGERIVTPLGSSSSCDPDDYSPSWQPLPG
jgi:Tol biopolymer transport system component